MAENSNQRMTKETQLSCALTIKTPAITDDADLITQACSGKSVHCENEGVWLSMNTCSLNHSSLFSRFGECSQHYSTFNSNCNHSYGVQFSSFWETNSHLLVGLYSIFFSEEYETILNRAKGWQGREVCRICSCGVLS